jgi:hypothetical protein
MQHTLQWAVGALSSKVEGGYSEVDHSHSPIVKVKNVWSHIPTPPHIFIVWCLIKLWETLVIPAKNVLFSVPAE